ncbi:hypothetical protein LOD99_136 [Oopsacas minuta]|uniref:Ribosome assembly factor mrt4 n=1 Tax=Oopsacas minuta TaxID=111878 RepID=A0AAV7K843_9METZ|nr:hypothetical protein LOD99_136 [Oopsacas minuta]
MPKSKRNKPYSLTIPKKKGLELKTKLLQDVRNCIDKHEYVYVFSVRDMRNSKLKDVRTLWESSRFFFGKNKVMAIALGLTPETEYREGLHKVSAQLKGDVGLFFTSEPPDKIHKWFNGYQECDYARAGNKATHNVTLPQGPLSQFQHTMEPQLRLLGMPTAMDKGVVTLITEFEVCKQDAVLNPEQCQILKLLAIPMAIFRISLLCYWQKEDSSFTQLCALEQEATVLTASDEESEPNSQDVEPGSPDRSVD